MHFRLGGLRPVNLRRWIAVACCWLRPARGWALLAPPWLRIDCLLPQSWGLGCASPAGRRPSHFDGWISQERLPATLLRVQSAADHWLRAAAHSIPAHARPIALRSSRPLRGLRFLCQSALWRLSAAVASTRCRATAGGRVLDRGTRASSGSAAGPRSSLPGLVRSTSYFLDNPRLVAIAEQPSAMETKRSESNGPARIALTWS